MSLTRAENRADSNTDDAKKRNFNSKAPTDSQVILNTWMQGTGETNR